MEIQPITNNQPHFNGYVGKSVKKYVNRAIDNECSKQFNKKTLNIEKLCKLEEYGEDILFRLSQYMTKTHEKTHIEMGNMKYQSHPRFKNPVTEHIVRIYSPLTNTKPYVDQFGTISMPKTMALNPIKDAGAGDLKKLDDICKNLETINQKDIDMAFYDIEKDNLDDMLEEEIGFFGGIRKAFREAKLEKFFEDIK